MQPAATTSLETIQKEKNYLVQLDGLRFIAVTLVMFDHWLGEANQLPIGYLGVNLFFVLSGFLITRILITSKQHDSRLNRGHSHSLKAFYIRRSLRIFPVYYLTILVLAVLNFQAVRKTFWWLVTYTPNLWIVRHQTWMGAIDHLWSLAVEEQFYIFFPFLVLFVPARYLLHTLYGLIGFAFLLRVYLFAVQAPWMAQFVLMPTCLDAFGMGGILAYLMVNHRERFLKLVTNNWFLLLSFCLYAGNIYLMKYLVGPPDYLTRNVATDITDRFATSLFCMFLIGRAVVGFKQPVKWVLENPVSNYLGRISYGLYLFHNLVFNYYHTPPTYPTLRIWNKAVSLISALDGIPALKMCYFYACTVLIATISWYLIEKPINALKNKFSY